MKSRQVQCENCGGYRSSLVLHPEVPQATAGPTRVQLGSGVFHLWACQRLPQAPEAVPWKGSGAIMIRRVLLRLHSRCHPDHVLVGWDGVALRCGTCLRLQHPENGLPRGLLPHRHPDYREEEL